MFDQIITVRSWESESFEMRVNLTLLPEMGLRKLQKLFRLMHRSAELNKESLKLLAQWLEAYCQTTKKQLTVASSDYQIFYRTPPDGQSKSRRAEAKRIRANNEALLRAVKKAKAAHEKAVKMQNYFTKERIFNYGTD